MAAPTTVTGAGNGSCTVMQGTESRRHKSLGQLSMSLSVQQHLWMRRDHQRQCSAFTNPSSEALALLLGRAAGVQNTSLSPEVKAIPRGETKLGLEILPLLVKHHEAKSSSPVRLI